MVWVAEEEGGQTEAEVKVGGGEGGVAIPLISLGEKLACGMPPDREKGKRKKREKRSEFERQKGWWVAFISQATPFMERRRVP